MAPASGGEGGVLMSATGGGDGMRERDEHMSVIVILGFENLTVGSVAILQVGHQTSKPPTSPEPLDDQNPPSASKEDDQQWLSYWILYSFLTLMEMLLQPLLEWIPIWYDVKLIAVAWLVLPQFRGAAFIYNKFVREQVIQRYCPGIGGGPGSGDHKSSPN
ncbi:protein YOP1-like [Bidens hawaiensis]|uniref:protein YOP1-like n=1 Tax=Bidens hawaiensis TaxID=980011 RepID=UPI00404983D1